MRLPPRPALATTAVALLTAVTVTGLPAPSAPEQAPAPRLQAAAAVAPAAVRTAAGLGYDTLAVRRGNGWFLRNSLGARGGSDGYYEGRSGWLPLSGDFDGNGGDSLVLFSRGRWMLSNSQGGPYNTVVWGRAGDRPVVGDWDGDGRDTIGVVRNGRWLLRGKAPFSFGRTGDVPVVGDWNGDGRDGIGIRRGNRFLLRDTATPGRVARAVTFGRAGYRPVVGDWNHDGRDDVGLFRAGTWYLRMVGGRTAITAFGRSGDLPVVRRVPSLASGLSHRVVRRYGSVAQVLSVALPASSTPDTVLAADRLGTLERTSTMAARTGAVAAVNGDFAAANGRPIHSYAADGALSQMHAGGGSGLGLSRGGATARASVPSVSVTLTPYGQSPRTVQRWNRGTPYGNQLSAFTAAGRRVERPPAGACYAQLVPTGARFSGSAGVQRMLRVLGTRCGGRAATVPAAGVLLVGVIRGTSGAFVRGLSKGQLVAMEQLLGYPGSVSLVGGSEPLVSNRQVLSRFVDRPGSYASGRQPRTAVGVTGAGRLVMVVVDGRRKGWSRGMTLRQLATLLRDLGVREAINLDGGGSSTMVLSGLVVNRPSDGRERRVSSALVVRRGQDPGQSSLRVGPLPLPPVPGTLVPAPAPADPGDLQPILPGVIPGIPGLSSPAAPTSVTTSDGRTVRTTSDWVASAQDPGSTGGLAQTQDLAGAPLDATLRLALDLLEGGQG